VCQWLLKVVWFRGTNIWSLVTFDDRRCGRETRRPPCYLPELVCMFDSMCLKTVGLRTAIVVLVDMLY
jgi:hypothetical protein